MKEEALTVMAEVEGAASPVPHRKADKVTPGRLSQWGEEGTVLFTANRERPELKREVIHDEGGVRLSKTQGEKESSIILTAKVDADCVDPVGELQRRVYEQLKGKAKREPQVPTANFLLDEDGRLKVWRRSKQKELCAFLTIDASRDKAFMASDLMETLAKINRVISKNF